MNTDSKKLNELPVLATGATGNLLASVAPPSELPNFITAAVATTSLSRDTAQLPPQIKHDQLMPFPEQGIDNSQPIKENFSPVIPFSKGEPTLPIRSPVDSQTTVSSESLPCSTPDIDKIGDVMPGSGLLTWVKGAVSTGGILYRVAEKAKSSVDSMITTLDPQMKEYLNSGGDILIVVASDQDVEVSSIREAFQMTFGKATVIGYPSQSEVSAAQPVGYAIAYAAAKQRIAHVRSVHGHLHNNIPVVAVERFLQEVVTDRWYEMSLLVASHTALGVELCVQSQSTVVPLAAIATARAASPQSETGFAVTIDSIMGDNLQVVHSRWHEACTGISRREILLLAAKSLAGSYKKMLAVSAGET